MRPIRIGGPRLELTPLPAAAAAALPDDRSAAIEAIGSSLPAAWPQIDLLDVLPMQAAAGPAAERFGILVPAGIGINIENPEVIYFEDNGSYAGIELCDQPCISPLHTHDESGIVHTESADAVPAIR